MSRPALRLLLALALAAPIAGPALAWPRAFSFFAVQFERPERAEADARAFLAERVAPGLPLTEARRRLEGAGLRCRPVATGGLDCRRSTPLHIGGGLIGEERWAVAVAVAVAGAGAVRTAELDHRVIGTGPPNPQ